MKKIIQFQKITIGIKDSFGKLLGMLITILNIVNGLLQCDQMLDKKVAQFSQKLPEIVTTVIDSDVRLFKISSISWQTFWLLLCEN